MVTNTIMQAKVCEHNDHLAHFARLEDTTITRLAPVLKTIFHQCVISYTYSQSNSDGSVLKQIHQS